MFSPRRSHVFCSDVVLSSPRRRTSGWNTNILIFSPIIGTFPDGIYIKYVIDLKRGTNSRGGSYTSISRVFLSRLSFSRVFSFFVLDFELLFGAVLEDPTARGYLVAVELSFG